MECRNVEFVIYAELKELRSSTSCVSGFDRDVGKMKLCKVFLVSVL